MNLSTVAKMIYMCNVLGMDSKAYLGDVDVSGAKDSMVVVVS